MKNQYTLSEKIEYFEKLLAKQEAQVKVLDAKNVIAQMRLAFLVQKLKELKAQGNN